MIVRTSENKYNLWAITDSFPRESAMQIRYLCRYLFGGDYCSTDIFHVGRMPGTVNVKPKNFFRTEIAFRKEKAVLNTVLLKHLVIKKIYEEEDTDEVLQCLSKFYKGPTTLHRNEKLSYEQPTLDPDTDFVEVKRTNFESSRGLSWKFRNREYSVVVDLRNFLKRDGCVDRSRVDWSFLTKICEFELVESGATEEDLKKILRFLLKEFSLKYEETTRFDYVCSTVENFMRSKSWLARSKKHKITWT